MRTQDWGQLEQRDRVWLTRQTRISNMQSTVLNTQLRRTWIGIRSVVFIRKKEKQVQNKVERYKSEFYRSIAQSAIVTNENHEAVLSEKFHNSRKISLKASVVSIARDTFLGTLRDDLSNEKYGHTNTVDVVNDDTVPLVHGSHRAHFRGIPDCTAVIGVTLHAENEFSRAINSRIA